METEKMNAYQARIQQRLAGIRPYLARYADGDFSRMLPVPADTDEFTGLVNSINHMVTDFQSMLNELDENETTMREQKNLLDAIANTSPVLIYVFDLERQSNVYNNPGVELLLGYSPEQMYAMGDAVLQTIIHPDDLPVIAATQERLKQASDDDVLEVDLRLRHVDGTWHTFHSYERPFRRKPDGSLKQLIGVSMDITDTLVMSAALKESEERFRLAIDASNLGVFDFDLRTTEVDVSQEWLAMLDYQPGDFDLDFEKWVTMLHPEDVPHTMQVYQDYITGKMPFYEVEFRMRKKGGDYRWILAKGRVVEHNEAGEPIRMLGVHMNIDQRKESEQVLVNSMHQLEETNQCLRVFNRMAVDRENKMIALKQEVNTLSEQLGKRKPYDLTFLITDGGDLP